MMMMMMMMMMICVRTVKIVMIHSIGDPQAKSRLWGFFIGLEADQTNWKVMNFNYVLVIWNILYPCVKVL